MPFNIENQLPASINQLTQLSTAGSETFTRDASGAVSEIRVDLPNGDTRITTINRSPNGDVLSMVITFENSPLTKTYTLVRDPDGTVTGVTES